MPELILNPLLRYVDPRDASVWVETSQACEVSVLNRSASTFHLEGHHYAMIYITELVPGTAYDYTVALDGEQVWPKPDTRYPPAIHTACADQPLRILFGSCRLSLSGTPPYTLAK
jgi:hypothetical protein